MNVLYNPQRNGPQSCSRGGNPRRCESFSVAPVAADGQWPVWRNLSISLNDRSWPFAPDTMIVAYAQSGRSNSQKRQVAALRNMSPGTVNEISLRAQAFQ
jgi:hypothetical protein